MFIGNRQAFLFSFFVLFLLLAPNTCKSANPRSVLPPFTPSVLKAIRGGPGASYPPAASDWLLSTCRHVDLFRSAEPAASQENTDLLLLTADRYAAMNE